MSGKLNRSITTAELIALNKFFAAGRGYKDLIRDMEKSFNVKMTKQEAKHFLESRSWAELLEWLTGEKIDTGDLDHIPEIEYKHFELLDKMLELSKQDNIEQNEDIERFNSGLYYIPSDVKYFNMPLYGEIITYKFKEPFVKCFLLNEKRKIEKIEDVPLSQDMPAFLMSIIRKINNSTIEFKGECSDLMKAENLEFPLYLYSTTDNIEKEHRENILNCELFKKYGFVAK